MLREEPWGDLPVERSSFKLALAEVISVEAEGPILYQSRAERRLSPLAQAFIIATLKAAALPVGSSGMVIKPLQQSTLNV